MSDHRSARQRARAFARPLGITAVLLAGLALSRTAHAAEDCKAADGARFICGVTNVEDWAQPDGTHWVIGSNLAAAGKQGTLYLFDTRHDTASAVEPASIAIKPDKTKYPDCPGAPDWKIFGPHGLDITPASGNHRTLYAVNHGGREAVEVFEVDFSKEKPAFTWTGCLTAPNGSWPDAVASVPGGGLIVTSLWDPTDNDRLAKLSAGQPVGGLFEWTPGKGWSSVPGSDGMSGPNGVITTPDGKSIYVAVWSGKQLTRLSRGEMPVKKDTVDTGFLTDNVRWSPDGKTIFAGGQATTVKEVLNCFESSTVNCTNVPFTVAAVDPKTLKQSVLVKPGIYGGLGAGTGAIEVNHHLWVSTFRGDRIAIFPMK